jgi:streptogramin lyase
VRQTHSNAMPTVAFLRASGARLAGLAASLAMLAGCGGSNGTAVPNVADAAKPAVSRAASPSFVAYTAGKTPGFPSTGSAQDIVAGPNGSMWFTDAGTHAIGRLSAKGVVTEFQQGLPTTAEPYVIVPAPDGGMWFSDYSGVTVGHISHGGTIVEYSGPQESSDHAAGIALAPDGTPWFITFGAPPMLGHVTSQGQVETIALPPKLSPDGTLAADAAGNLWFIAIDPQDNGVIVERTPAGKLIKRQLHMYHQFLPCCPHRAPKRLIIGSDGNPWFSALDYGRGSKGTEFFGTVAGGQVNLYKLTSRGISHAAFASGIASNANQIWLSGSDPYKPDGTLWQTVPGQSQTTYDLPYSPIELTFDGKGHPWFTAGFTGVPSEIVEVVPPKQ